MALSQCDTTIIDLTLGGNIGEDFCSFRNEDWYLSKAPHCPVTPHDSFSSEGDILDDTIIPVAAAKKRRKSLQDANPGDNERKSARLDAQRKEAALSPDLTGAPQSPQPVDTAHGDLDSVVVAGSFQNIKTIISPVRFKTGTFQTSSVAKQNNYKSVFQTKQTRKNPQMLKGNKPVTRSVLSVPVQQPPVVRTAAAAANVAASVSEPVAKQKVTLKKSKLDPPSDPIPSVPGKTTQVSAPQKDPPNSKKPLVLENVGIFWDIENIVIPSSISVSLLVRKIRNTFVTMDKREVEFMCVCDVHKEKR